MAQPNQAQLEAWKKIYRRGLEDPCWFITNVLLDQEKRREDPDGVRLWKRQEEIVHKVVVRRRVRVGVITGPKTGKTWIAAAIILYLAVYRPKTYIRLCAPTEQVIIDSLYKEIVDLWHTAQKNGFQLCPQPPAIDPKKGLRFSNGSTIGSVSATKEEAAQGKSGENQFFVVDEACGYPPELWAVIFRNLMGGGQILALSNHTHAVGIIYEAATLGTGDWDITEFQVTENPNFAPCHCGHGQLKHEDDRDHCHEHGCDCQKFRPTEKPIPGLANPRGFFGTIEQFGKDSPQADIALGRWPRTGGNTVVPFGMLQHAAERQNCICGHSRSEHKGFHGSAECVNPACPCTSFEVRVPRTAGLPVLGVDPAEFGSDDTGIVLRRGMEIAHVQFVHGMDAEEVANVVEDVVTTSTDREPVTIYCDKTGNDAVFQELCKRARKYQDTPFPWTVIGINFGETAWNTDKFPLIRDELWWGARTWIKDGGAVPHHPRLFSELSAPTYTLGDRQRIQIEKKKDIKKKLPGNKSPDVAEAFILSLLQARVPTLEGEVKVYTQSRYDGWGGM